MTTIPDLGQAHKTCGWVKHPNPPPRRGQRKKINENRSRKRKTLKINLKFFPICHKSTKIHDLQKDDIFNE